jgi:hypothetical protein
MFVQHLIVLTIFVLILYIYNFTNIDSKFIINILVILTFLLYLNSWHNKTKVEGFAGALSPTDVEAVRNMSSIYNTTGTATLPNLHITGALTVDGQTTTNATSVQNLAVATQATVGPYITISNAGDLFVVKNATNNGNYFYMNQNGNFGIWGPKGGPFIVDTNGNVSTTTETTTSLNVNGPVHATGNIASDTQMQAGGGRVLTDALTLGIRSSRGGYLIDNGGWSSSKPDGPGCWEAMKVYVSAATPKVIAPANSCTSAS